MTPRKDDVEIEDSEGSLEDQLRDWADEDRDLEGRKPDLGEIESDPSAL